MIDPSQAPRIGRITGETVSWFHKNLERSNSHCLYCGQDLRVMSPELSNLEHWIAREFVPTGALDGQQFNFLFRACVSCNRRKADLERHVSSITLVSGPAAQDDPLAAKAALRKAERDFHPVMPGTPIKDAGANFTLHSSFGGGQISFGMIGPPQVHRPFLAELAFCHVQALFSLLTSPDYRDGNGLRLLPQDEFSCYWFYPHNDWGNPQLLELAERVKDWPCYANITTARGYFRATLRISESDEYFWALEWNRSYRVVGAIGSGMQRVFTDLPAEGWRPAPGGGRMRQEIALGSRPDLLFAGIVRTDSPDPS